MSTTLRPETRSTNDPAIYGAQPPRCLRCGRTAADLVHDNPNDHGWTGCKTMHPFVDEHGKTLLKWAARNVALQGRTGQKHHAPDPQYAEWNHTIDVAKAAVERMLAPISAEDLAQHDKYFQKEYEASQP